MKQVAKVSLFVLHLTGVVLCLVCTVITIDGVVPVIPRYTALGGWLSHLDFDPMHVMWLTTWSLALAALPAIGLFSFKTPVRQLSNDRRARVRKSRLVRQPAIRNDPDELVISWVGDENHVDDLSLVGMQSNMFH
jgi:hypothetical protein